MAMWLRLPRIWGKSPREPHSLWDLADLTDRKERNAVEEVMLRAEEHGWSEGNTEAACARAKIKRMTITNAAKHVRRLASHTHYAVSQGWCLQNAFEGMVWDTREIKEISRLQAARSRLPWREKLAALLATAAFTEPLSDPGDPMFWAPLIAELDGLRMEEVLQLKVEAFLRENGVDYIQVQVSCDVHSVKSEAAVRRAPIHKALIELGLLQLVELRRQQGETRLFKDLKRGQSKKTLSEIFSKRYRRYRKSNNVYDERRDFHSHRTGFFSNLRNAGVGLDDRKLLMGHIDDDMSNRHYNPEGVTLIKLQEYVNRIEIDLSRVRRPFAPETARSKPILSLVN